MLESVGYVQGHRKAEETHSYDTPQPLEHLAVVAAVEQLAHLGAVQRLGGCADAARRLGGIEGEFSGWSWAQKQVKSASSDQAETRGLLRLLTSLQEARDSRY
jgi:hypothetical protein